MGSILSRVCPCLGARETKVLEQEDVKLSPDEYITKQYKPNNLIQDELFIPVSYYVMNKRHYHNI